MAGGGIVSALSTKVIGNSDFFTAAFPAEYNNAISGIFDMRLRNGNSELYENTFQAGILGIDVASEGPLGRNGSYIVNYRYSFLGLATHLGLADLDGQVLDYQDLNFKFNMPTAKAGTFALWGTGLIDDFRRPAKTADEIEYSDDGNENVAKQRMLATGLTHRIGLRSGGTIRTTLAYTVNTERTYCDNYFYALPSDSKASVNRFFTTDKTNSDIILNSSFNKQYTKQFSNTVGFTLTSINADLNIKKSPSNTAPMMQIVDSHNRSLYASVYTNNQLLLGRATLNLGLSYQYLAFNHASSLEPRIGFAYTLTPRLKLSSGYGIYSRKENTDVYFVEQNGQRVNADLGFTKALNALRQSIMLLPRLILTTRCSTLKASFSPSSCAVSINGVKQRMVCSSFDTDMTSHWGDLTFGV